MRDYRPATRPEPAFPIRLVALDLDGTMIGGDFQPAARVQAAIREAVARGVRVSIATGRMASSGAVYAHLLGLREPIVAHQGAVVRAMPARLEVVDPDELPFRASVGRLLHHSPLAADATRDAIRWCLEQGLDPHVNDLERIVVWRDDRQFEDYSGYLGPDAEIVADLARAITHPVSKVIAVGDPPRPMEVLAAARRAFEGRAGVTVSHPRFLEFIAPGVSKGRAVAWLAHRAGVPMSQVMAVGDALNDLEMIGDAGHGAAMASAPAVVRAAGRYVARPVEEDGVAELIEALVLAPPEVAARNGERLAAEAAAAAADPLVTAARIVPDGDAARAEAVALLRAGSIVAIPTDTVYGIAADMALPDAIERLFAAKRRPPEKAVAVLLADADQAGDLGELNAAARLLAARFWPGGLTLVLPLRPDARLPRVLAAGTPTIGVRVPDHPAPRALAAALGPLPTTSANLSGMPDARDATEIAATLGDAIALVIDGGPIRGGPGSTVVDCTGESPRRSCDRGRRSRRSRSPRRSRKPGSRTRSRARNRSPRPTTAGSVGNPEIRASAAGPGRWSGQGALPARGEGRREPGPRHRAGGGVHDQQSSASLRPPASEDARSVRRPCPAEDAVRRRVAGCVVVRFPRHRPPVRLRWRRRRS